MQFTIITLFPEVVTPILSSSILGRAQKKNKITVKTLNLREFGIGRHRTVDDKPYGGGVGMVLRVDVLDQAIAAARIKGRREAVILIDPKGIVYKQEVVETLAKGYDHLILVCGHYEGFDERIREYVDLEISIGDYVLSGGEIAAAAIVESVARLVPGVLVKEEAPIKESFSKTSAGRILEAPCYTRPAVYKGKKIPKELLSGNPELVEAYRKTQAEKLTAKRRPDLLRK
ncbi:MAG TPA: tRNA (guanosine(37)-N1)-methyltransferase TrmD [Patescibacteria group bacterium]|nr:tRNA (guanosine(37)-N1)-methyltransferase TrmD [Patescibacteria group bacterium]